jgi:hypothetical protein
MSAAVSVMAAGSGLPLLIAKIELVKEISVAGGLFTSWLGMNSAPFPSRRRPCPRRPQPAAPRT